MDESLYERFFEGRDSKTSAHKGDFKTPRYLLRPALAPAPRRDSDGSTTVAFDFFFWGASDEDARGLLDAWRRAGELGFGRDRIPFAVVDDGSLAPGGAPVASLGALSRTLPEDAPVRLRFLTPLRLFEKDRPIARPTAEALVRAALARIATITAAAASSDSERGSDFYPGRTNEFLELARELDCKLENWRDLGVRRYSGRQKKEIRLDGAMGDVLFPTGLGALAPLMAAAEWTHLGKSTTLGLGRPFLYIDSKQ